MLILFKKLLKKSLIDYQNCFYGDRIIDLIVSAQVSVASRISQIQTYSNKIKICGQ